MVDSITPTLEVALPAMYGISVMFADPTRANPVCLGKVEWPDATFRQVQWNRLVTMNDILYTRFSALLLGPDDSVLAVAEVSTITVESLFDQPIGFLMASARENTVLRAGDLKRPVIQNDSSVRLSPKFV